MRPSIRSMPGIIRRRSWMPGPGESVVEENQKEAGDTAKNCFITHASITARPFFEKRGYRVIREQLVERRGEKLKNFVMEKAFFAGGKEAEQKGSL